jgi:demethylmenaquinone methyltransferase / 2-methoxy-6-polyprenyl-1,4-benzoquinol methylase
MMMVHEGHERATRFFTITNANSYDLVVRLATFGQDNVWKQEIIRIVGFHNHILELACGTGILLSKLADRGKSIAGIDLTFEYLLVSKHKLRTPLILQGTAEVLPYRNHSFDALVSSYLAKYVDVQVVIDECWRVLRPGGIVVFHDFTYPRGIMRILWNTYFALLRLIGKFLPSWKVVFGQLDDLIKKSRWVDQTVCALKSGRFRNVSCKYYSAGTAAIVSAQKP